MERDIRPKEEEIKQSELTKLTIHKQGEIKTIPAEDVDEETEWIIATYRPYGKHLGS